MVEAWICLKLVDKLKANTHSCSAPKTLEQNVGKTIILPPKLSRQSTLHHFISTLTNGLFHEEVLHLFSQGSKADLVEYQ